MSAHAVSSTLAPNSYSTVTFLMSVQNHTALRNWQLQEKSKQKIHCKIASNIAAYITDKQMGLKLDMIFFSTFKKLTEDTI